MLLFSSGLESSWKSNFSKGDLSDAVEELWQVEEEWDDMLRKMDKVEMIIIQ